MAVSYDEFLKAAQSSGLMNQFSQTDLATAQSHPEFGMSLLSLKKDWNSATTDEQRLLSETAANELRKSYGNYSGRQDGSGYISGGKIPGQIDDTLDKLASFGSFTFDKEAPTYSGEYENLSKQLLDEVVNRPDFAWSKETDPQWASYKKEYLREGDRATQSALAQASAASGGRPSSYAVNAATQAGDYYATKLSDMIPTLYQQAYNKYVQDYQMKLSDLEAVNTAKQFDYGKYLDEVNRYNTDRNFAFNLYQDEFGQLQDTLSALQKQDGVDYGRYIDKINLDTQAEARDYERAQAEREYAVNQVADILSAGGTPSDELLAAAGLTAEYAQGVHAGWQREQDEAQRELVRAQVDAILSAGGMPSQELIEASGYSNEYIKAISAAVKKQQVQAATKSSRTPTKDKDTPVVNPTEAAIEAFRNGDRSDATIKALLDAGYTETQIKDAGYTGDYFKKSGNPTVNPNGYVPTSPLRDLDRAQEQTARNLSQVRNPAAESWVNIPGMSRVTWAELERMVEKGQVLESVDPKTGQYSYRVNPDYKK